MNTIKMMELPERVASARCTECAFTVNASKDVGASAGLVRQHVEKTQHPVNMTITKSVMWFSEEAIERPKPTVEELVDVYGYEKDAAGFRGGIICDDPIKPPDANSRALRQKLNDTFDSRLAPPPFEEEPQTERGAIEEQNHE